MSDDDASNVIPLHLTQMSIREMSRYFAQLSDALAKHQCALEPMAFALVLINAAKLRVYHAGFPNWDLFRNGSPR